jgi:hypothetical protein
MQLVSGLSAGGALPSLTLFNSWIDPSTLQTPSVPTIMIHDRPVPEGIPSTRRVIYLQAEPEIIIPQRSFLLANWPKFYAILTYDDVVLRSCPNAKKYLFGGCWVHPPDRARANPMEKQFRVSTLVGWKAQGEGHLLRQALYRRQAEISIPYTFYRSSHGTLLPEVTTNPIYTAPSKYDLFKDVQFSIVVENSKQPNYFTEKLIDCFIAKTVPIYWGCPNIGEYFYTEGMILLTSSSVEDALAVLARLTPDTYAQFLPMVEQNYQNALRYVSVEQNINRALKSIPDY